MCLDIFALYVHVFCALHIRNYMKSKKLVLVVHFYSAHCTNCLHAHLVVYITLYNLRWWCFFIQPLAQFLHLRSGCES